MFHPTIHRCIFWVHLVTGIAAGLVILMLAVTGLLMSFETQIVDGLERSIVREKFNGDITPLTAAEMIAAFEKADIQGSPSSLSYSSVANTPTLFLANRGERHLFHPTTGESLGKGAVKTRQFFKSVLSIHRWLTFSSEPSRSWKDIGGQITGGGTLGFLLLLISGLIIWIPKKLRWNAFKAVLTIHPRLKGRARDWNWHNVIGIWASPFILTLCLTGIIMSYPWANRLLFQSFGETPPVRKMQTGQRGAPARKPIAHHRLDSLAEFAKRKVPAWQNIVMELPTTLDQPLVVTIADAGRGRPDRREKFTLDPVSLAILKHETFSDMKPGQRARQIVRWLHTGELGGWPGQLLALLTCSAVIVLLGTGFTLSIRRFFQKRKPTTA